MSDLLETLHKLYTDFAPKLRSASSISDIEQILLNMLDVSFCIYNTDGVLIYSAKDSHICSNDFSALPSVVQSKFLQLLRSMYSFSLNISGLEITGSELCRVPTCNSVPICSFFPIYGEKDRMYCLIVWKCGGALTELDALVCSAAAMSIGMLIGRAQDQRTSRDQAMKASAHAAVSVLSYSEHTAIRELLTQMDGRECTIVISDFSSRIFVTRSVISSALRKMESSDVLFVKSLGMRGTYIRINNPFIYDAIGCKNQSSQALATQNY